jgi:hypothetical protein
MKQGGAMLGLYRKGWKKVEQGAAMLGWNIYYTGKGGVRWNKVEQSGATLGWNIYYAGKGGKRWNKVKPHWNQTYIILEKVEQSGVSKCE